MAEKRAKTVRPVKTAKKTTAAGTRARTKRPAKKSAKKLADLRHESQAESIVAVVKRALDDMKAVDIRTIDVRKLTDIADTLIVASGTSDRHVRAIADRVVEFAKQAGYRPMGVEGEREGEWVLVDLQDVIVHIMLPRVREFYRLESLWDGNASRREAAAGGE